jgi:hypothetical protein
MSLWRNIPAISLESLSIMEMFREIHQEISTPNIYCNYLKNIQYKHMNYHSIESSISPAAKLIFIICYTKTNQLMISITKYTKSIITVYIIIFIIMETISYLEGNMIAFWILLTSNMLFIFLPLFIYYIFITIRNKNDRSIAITIYNNSNNSNNNERTTSIIT